MVASKGCGEPDAQSGLHRFTSTDVVPVAMMLVHPVQLIFFATTLASAHVSMIWLGLYTGFFLHAAMTLTCDPGACDVPDSVVPAVAGEAADAEGVPGPGAAAPVDPGVAAPVDAGGGELGPFAELLVQPALPTATRARTTATSDPFHLVTPCSVAIFVARRNWSVPITVTRAVNRAHRSARTVSMGSMTDLAARPSEHLASPPVSHRVLVIAMGVAALAAWIYLESSGDAGAGVVLFVGAFAALAALAPGVRLLESPDTDRPTPDRPPLGERLEALAAPGPLIWLLPFPVLVVMLITLPLAYHHSPGNNSIIGLAFACALIGGTVGTVLGSRAWTIVMLVSVGAAGDPREGPISPALAMRMSYVVGAAAVVIAIVGSLLTS